MTSDAATRETGVQRATRTCEWCAETIPEDALRCPRCQKWRRDIDRERVLMYTFVAAIFIPAFIFGIGLRNQWWHESTGTFGLSSEFSFEAFMNSGSGILIILAGAVLFALSFYYYAKVSTKIQSWWWF
jgi:predicted nucleic acid-binding Zn ribbon protein